MKRKGYTEEHTIAILKEREVGGSVPDLTRRHGAADNTIYRRKSNFGAMKGASQGRRDALLRYQSL